MSNYFYETDFQAKNAQEKYDYDRAVMVFEEIYSAFTGCTIEYKETPDNSIADMRYTISGNTRVRKYVGEIKHRNKEYQEGFSFPLLVRKYTGLKRFKEKDEKLFYLSIHLNMWALFDLDNLDLNKCEIKDWYIKDVQYSDCTHKSWQPTIFIPITQAKITGKCLNGIPIVTNKDNNCIN